MRPISLTIEAFRSFATRQTFTFEREGLYFLTGDNQAEPRLGSNGAGKSSVWDALCWCLFGKTLRGLKAGEVANWDVKTGTRVEFRYEYEGLTYCVIRTWNPNTWQLLAPMQTLDLVEDETNLLHRHLRLSFLAACHCIFMAQQQSMFLDLSSSEKASLLAEVLDLDTWLSRSDTAKTLAANNRECLIRTELDLEKLTSRLTTLKETNVAQYMEQWEDDRKMRLVSMQKEKEELQRKAVAIVKQVDELEKKPSPKLKLLEDNYKTINQEVSQKQVQVRVKEQEWKRLSREKEQVRKTCPTCGTTLSEEKYQNISRKLSVGVKAAEEELEELEKELSRIQKEAGALHTKLADMQQEKRRLDSSLRNELIALEQVERDLDRLDRDIEAETSRENPHQLKIARQNSELESLQDEIIFLRGQKEELEFQRRCFEFWVGGFREIRLNLIQQAMTQLEVESNSCLMELGLVGWELRFSVEKETKKGTKQLGFHVTVLSPVNKKPVPWEAWSGGESQRLRIAATMGLANLIRSATGTTLGLEIWDEPTQHLNAQGVEDLMECLLDRSAREDRQIWVVEHRVPGFSDFDGSVTVTKGEWGSVIAPISR